MVVTIPIGSPRSSASWMRTWSRCRSSRIRPVWPSKAESRWSWSPWIGINARLARRDKWRHGASETPYWLGIRSSTCTGSTCRWTVASRAEHSRPRSTSMAYRCISWRPISGFASSSGDSRYGSCCRIWTPCDTRWWSCSVTSTTGCLAARPRMCSIGAWVQRRGFDRFPRRVRCCPLTASGFTR